MWTKLHFHPSQKTRKMGTGALWLVGGGVWDTRLNQMLGYWFEIVAVVPSSFVKCTVNFSLNVCALS